MVYIVNRVIIALVALFVLAGAIITLLVAAGAMDPTGFGWFDATLERVADATGGAAAAVIAVSVVVALLMLALIYFQFVPSRPRRRTSLLVGSGNEGMVSIDQESVRVLAEKTAATVRNVISVKCSVGEKAEGLAIGCRAAVSLGSNIPEVSAELKQKVKDNVEKLTGLPVSQVNVSCEYEAVEAKRFTVE